MKQVAIIDNTSFDNAVMPHTDKQFSHTFVGQGLGNIFTVRKTLEFGCSKEIMCDLTLHQIGLEL